MQNNKIKNIKNILEPKSIAIVGASIKCESVGYKLLKNVIDCGYQGKIFPINPKYDSLFLNQQFYKSLLNVKEKIDLAIICVPSIFVENVIQDCHQCGINSIVILSSGFKEAGEEGKKREVKITQLIKEYKMNAVGPNTIGILNLSSKIKLNATFIKNTPNPGSIALITQSGALGCGIMNIMDNLPIGISKMISIGNQSDLTVTDFIEYLEKDNNTKQIVLYLETIKETSKFREICERVAKVKPIFAIKAGRSERGSIATISHTGSLAGNDKFADSLLKQSDCIRELDIESILNDCYTHSICPNLTANNIAIITNGMGPAILATDKLNDLDINLNPLNDVTKAKLKEVLSPLASLHNPIDLVSSATLKDFENALTILFKDENIDTVFLIYLELNDIPSTRIALEMDKIKKKYPNKNLISVYITNNEEFEKTRKISLNSPIFKHTDEAVYAIKSIAKYNKLIHLDKNDIFYTLKNKEKISKIINKANKDNRTLLTTSETLQIFELMHFPISNFILVKDVDELERKAKEITYPVVLKISSTTLTHKTDVHGVILNIQSYDDLKNELEILCKNLKEIDELKNIDNFIIQPMTKSKRELVIGLTNDKNYGPVLMFGQGGIFIEAQKDVAFRISPLNNVDIEEIIEEPKVSSLLKSLRGLPEANIDNLKNYIAKIDCLVQTFPIIKELDINPLLIDDKDGNIFAVDGRIVLEKQ